MARAKATQTLDLNLIVTKRSFPDRGDRLDPKWPRNSHIKKDQMHADHMQECDSPIPDLPIIGEQRNRERERERKRERERESERDKKRDTERETRRKIQRETYRESERATVREPERETVTMAHHDHDQRLSQDIPLVAS